MTSEFSQTRSREVGGRMRSRLAVLLPIVLLAGCAPRAVTAPLPELHSGCRASGGDPDVVWHAPVPPEDADPLTRWCAQVGDPLVRSVEAPVPRLDSLLIVTWNVHGGGGDLEAFLTDLRAGALTEGRRAGDFVILLQETFRADSALPSVGDPSAVPRAVINGPRSGERTDIETVAEAFGLELFYVPSMRNGPHAEDRGNAILSTVPLGLLEAIELPFEAQRRVALAATISGTTAAGEPWRLRLVNTHLDTRTSGRGLLSSTGAGRLRQARALLRALPGETPTILAGDFNTWSLGALERSLPFLRSRFPATPTVDTGPTFRTRWGYSRRLDHVFFGLPDDWRGTYRKWPDRYGSDHYPLVAWVWFG